MSIILGALGSIIGYLGAEAATESFFERLLWPERFYNDANPYVLLTLAMCLPMAGPLHGAALASLDAFRNNGLYLGKRRGDMLGTTFFHDSETKYYHVLGPKSDQKEDAKEARNAFWVQVLSQVKCRNRSTRLPVRDASAPALDQTPSYRAMQLVNHLKLHYASDASQAGVNVVEIREAAVEWRTIVGTVMSEFSSIAVAITAAVAKPFRTYWLAGYLVIPLALKLVALFTSVRRDSILDDKPRSEGRPETEDELYMIDSRMLGIIQAPTSVMQQFSRHYGHPIRDSGVAGRRDRMREVTSMALIYLFVLYFPAGLISSLWMPYNTQLLWLSFQVYTIVMMHVVRIVGWDNCGRTEARVARYLEQRKHVWLRRPDGLGIVAVLETADVPKVDDAKQELDAIVEAFFQARRPK